VVVLSETAKVKSGADINIGRYQSLPLVIKAIYIAFTVIGIGCFCFFIYGLNISGWVFQTYQYWYLLYLLFFSGVFVLLPARKKDRNRLPWYDVAIACLIMGICGYWASNAWRISQVGWVPARTIYDWIFALVFTVAALEGCRRLAGIPFTVVNLVAIIYPMVAGYFPGILKGIQFDLPYVVSTLAYSAQGILGMPAQTMGSLLIGFLVFCGFLIGSGAGNFFMDLALSLFGRFRGGAGKVAVLASALFGLISGNSLANIVSTGSMTIPAMKRSGFPAEYAAATVACAACGSPVTPPVMGVVAFLIAIFTGLDFASVLTAAVLPAVLYYFGLLIQVDGYAAKNNLKSMQPQELPSLRQTLKTGWTHLIVLAFLVFGLVYMQWGARAAIYASALMVLISSANKSTRITPAGLLKALSATAQMITQTFAVLVPMSFIIAGLSMTGAITSLTAQIHTLGGTNVYFVLLIGMAVCYIFGLVGMEMIAYIVLAMTMAPTVAAIGNLNIIGVHLFIVYYCIMGSLTPPVAMLSFVAAGVAGARQMKTAWLSMRLGIVLIFIPFFFVTNEALLLQGPILVSTYTFVITLIGVWLLASSLEGYLIRLGRLIIHERVLLLVAGGLMISLDRIPCVIGALLAVIVILTKLVRLKSNASQLVSK